MCNCWKDLSPVPVWLEWFGRCFVKARECRQIMLNLSLQLPWAHQDFKSLVLENFLILSVV